MKVYYIDPQSYNNPSLYDYSLLTNIERQHIDITYYYSDLYQLPQLPADKNCCIFHYSHKNGLKKSISYIKSIYHLLLDVLSQKPNLVHIQWIKLWEIDYIFLWFLKRMGIKTIFTAHNLLPHVTKKGDATKYKLYYRLVDTIIVHNQRTKEEMIEQMGIDTSKIHVIFHGVSDTNFKESQIEQRAAELREQIGIQREQLVFSCLGIQKTYKGTDLVIDLWANDARFANNPNCILLIVGKNCGVDYSKLANIKNVYIEDAMISDLDFQAYLQLSSVVLLPYLKISQSGILFSAIQRNTPVLVGEVGGLSEPLRFGKIGWNMGIVNKEHLHDAMSYLLDHPEEISKIKSDTKEFQKVCKQYDWETIGKNTSDLYKTI